MGFGANVRDAEYRQVQRFSFSNIEHFSTASLITRLTNDVSSVQMTLMMGMRMLVRAPVMLITALVMALRISLQLSQIFLVILPLLALMVFIMLRYVGPFFTSLQKATDGLNLVVQEDLNAIRVVKSFVREDREKEKFFQRSETLRQTAERPRLRGDLHPHGEPHYGRHHRIHHVAGRSLCGRRPDALRRPAGLLHTPPKFSRP